ncbi:CRISPR-associated protein (Cas_Csn2) [Pilibacter termitis]|uniref:CRISPR-associated protein (Cas_Csn2) n=1 Tax=Pilibacter termitis TaxID=263852 RepID=A0A1T4LDY2_9ENTE|nr:type II-A CRISPR-associated protein Csn2 [Pilibacter termitis]SJZ53002.1 CRISPR-associated protein (Cas_Csn2) [Pilibacter termitis]
MISINFEHLDRPIELEGKRTNILVVEENQLYSKIMFSLYNRTDEYFKIFDEKYKNIPEKKLLTIFNPLQFDFDERSLKTMLYNKILTTLNVEQTIKQDIAESYQSLVNKVMSYVYENEEIDVAFRDEIEMKELFKLIGLSINQERMTSIFEKVCMVIDTLNELASEKLLIFTNLNILLTREEYQAIVEQINLNNLTVLIIESNQYHLEEISHWYLDEDFFLSKNVV